MTTEITEHEQNASPSAHDDAVGNGNGAGDNNRGTKRQRPAADDDDDDEDKPGRERRKIEIKFIQDKSRRHITFSKRKAGIMKKVSRRKQVHVNVPRSFRACRKLRRAAITLGAVFTARTGYALGLASRSRLVFTIAIHPIHLANSDLSQAYELSVLTGTQVLLLVVSETGLVYTFTTPKLQPLVTKPEGKNLIQVREITGAQSDGSRINLQTII